MSAKGRLAATGAGSVFDRKISKWYATREDLRLEQRFETPRSVERVQRAVHGDDIRVARVWTQLEAKIDEKLKFLRRLALDGGCKSLPRRLGIIIATVGRRSWLLPPRLVQRPGIERVKTRFIHEIHSDLLGPASSPATAQASRPGDPSGPPSSASEWARMLLKALITGRPSCLDTQTLCGISASMSGICGSRIPG